MKLFKENKSLGILLIVSIIYVGITFLFINPLRMKNNDLEKQKSEILTLHKQRNTINTISKKEKQVEDIILLIEKNIGSMVDITSITKQSQQTENSNQTILEVRFSSNLNDIFNLNQKLKELNLENSIETIKVQRIQTESNKKSKVNCTITFKVV
ncbi:MAG: hypothetical protein Q606_CBAC00275G0021 [Intestinibacter bartlettii DORA_8_9]|uniref:General secretion pathway, M protein n=1 Tax=Intestinibacter bartlettii TaxID=261299 RepID=A0A6N3D611_9FIRM|nr:MAG: hypothetical protein Q606_CBAC00275G0021 [Intestinibacter bartlettii DORA_8_9]